MSHLGVPRIGHGCPYNQKAFEDPELFWEQFSCFLDPNGYRFGQRKNLEEPPYQEEESLPQESVQDLQQPSLGIFRKAWSFARSIISSHQSPSAAAVVPHEINRRRVSSKLFTNDGEIRAEIVETLLINGQCTSTSVKDESYSLRSIVKCFQRAVSEALAKKDCYCSLVEEQMGGSVSYKIRISKDFYSFPSSCASVVWKIVEGKLFDFLKSEHGIERRRSREGPNLWEFTWNPQWNPIKLPHYPLPEVEKVPPGEKKELGQDLYAFAQERYDTDVTINISDGQVLFAHKLVLSRCEALRTMLNSQMKEGLEGVIPFNDKSFTVVQTFLKYIYTEENPFEDVNAPFYGSFNQAEDFILSDAEDSWEYIETCHLLELAGAYHLDGLINCCAKYIALKHSDKLWKDVEECDVKNPDRSLVSLYPHKDLLSAYGAYCMRNGKPLSLEKRGLFKRLGLPLPPPSREVHIHCDIVFENTLGICFAPSFEVHLRFTWNQGRWEGRIPIGIEFKFVKISKDGTITWEQGYNRIYAEEGDAAMHISDIHF